MPTVALHHQRRKLSYSLNEVTSADISILRYRDDANFINFCTGKTISNGLQVQGGSCNPIPMGDIPAADKMVSDTTSF